MPIELPEVHLAGELGRAELTDALRSELIARIRRGAYAVAPSDVPAWQHRRMLTLARGIAVSRQLPGCCLGGLSAAAMHELPIWREPERTYAFQDSHVRSGLPRDIVRSVAGLPEEDVVEIDGVRVSSLRRTMVDCARTLHPRDALVVVDGGIRQIIEPQRQRRTEDEERAEELRQELLARLTRGMRHRVRATAVIRAAVPFAESAPESVIRWLAITRGMPTPVPQCEVSTPSGVVWTDLGWRRRDGSWVHAEHDGMEKYRIRGGTPEELSRALAKEKAREEAIVDATWPVRSDVVRFTYGQVRDERIVYPRLVAKFSHEDRADWDAAPAVPPALLPPRRHPHP